MGYSVGDEIYVFNNEPIRIYKGVVRNITATGRIGVELEKGVKLAFKVSGDEVGRTSWRGRFIFRKEEQLLNVPAFLQGMKMSEAGVKFHKAAAAIADVRLRTAQESDVYKLIAAMNDATHEYFSARRLREREE